jgi:membrane fusion protein (multidrug efflux system)
MSDTPGPVETDTPEGGGDGDPAQTTRAGFSSLHPRWRTGRIALLVAAALVLILLGAALRYWRLNAGLVKTDNAHTAGDLAPISSRIPGTVVRVRVNENDFVTTGTVLVELDPTDYRLARGHARADLEAARAQVEAARAALAAQREQWRAAVTVAQSALQAAKPLLPQAEAELRMGEQTTPAQIAQARAQVSTAEANVKAAKADLDVASRTVDRDRTLFAQGAIPAQQLDSDTAAREAATARYQAAQDALRQARDALVAAQASREHVAMARHGVEIRRGEISQAQAQVQQATAGETLIEQRARELAAAEARGAAAAGAVEVAEVNLSRTEIRAPADGWITNRTVEIGQVIQPNQPLLALALSRHIWVVANVRETRLASIRAGNPVRITVDAVRGHVFLGHVESIGAATGSATALLPPDNATGNFIKVVQLVPVRIVLDPARNEQPLQIGLSCEVTIDTRQGSR